MKVKQAGFLQADVRLNLSGFDVYSHNKTALNGGDCNVHGQIQSYN